MNSDEAELERIRRLADAIRAKMLVEIQLLARTRGKIMVECFPKGEGYDIDLTTKIR